MPNWCSNNLTLKHKDPAMIQRARDAFMRGEFLQEFIPCPEELRNATANFETNEGLVAKHGYSSWYDFNIANWGTKWDVGGEGCEAITSPNEISMSFDSAWAPPCNAYEKLLDMGFEIRATYYEPGMCFAGLWEDGSDDYYEYSNMSAEEIADTLPSELDEEFGISEQVAEWESEQEEEEE